MTYLRWPIPCLVALVLAFISSPTFAQVTISVDVAPPPLIEEDQPPIPDDGYIWTPGYWAYDEDQGAYYWVDGAWVQPPQPDLYWTPDYWAWDNGAYVYYPGYWGPTVGFYGGVNYGYGYWGNGYGGGRWDNGHFDYNTAANNVSGGRVHNTYADRSADQAQSSRVSFNGGQGGVQAQPSPQEREASQQSHVPRTAQQQAHYQAAAQTRSHQVKVSANKPAADNANKPAGSSAFTGENAQVQPKPESATTAPVQHESPFSSETQAKPEEKPDVRSAEQSSPEQVKPEEKPEVRTTQEPSHEEMKPEEKPAQQSEHSAPPVESHASQGPGPGAQSHPEAKPEAKPEGKPASGPSGGAKPAGPQQNNGH